MNTPLSLAQRRRSFRATPLLLSLVFLALDSRLPAQSPTPSSPPPRHSDASAAVAKQDDGTFLRRHESFLERGKAGPMGVLFLGDSITDNWSKAPDIWNKYYGKFQPANFGIGGDTTQNVIWRIDNGELDGIDPKVVVLMIGTNNSGSNTSEEIIAAVRKIIDLTQAKLPRAKILLLQIFPRGGRQNRDGSYDDGVSRLRVITAVNRGLAKMDDGKRVFVLDIGPRFLSPEGTISPAIMADRLHPTVAGYQIWADAMQPKLLSLLGQGSN